MKKPSPSSDQSQAREPDGMSSEWGSLVARAQREEDALQAAEQSASESRAGRTGQTWRRQMLTSVLVLLLVLAGALFGWYRMRVAPAPSASDLDQGRRALLALIDSSLADHVRVHGDYPEDLEEVLPLKVAVEYRRTLGGYELSVRLSDGEILTAKKP